MHRVLLDELGKAGLIDWSRASLDSASFRVLKRALKGEAHSWLRDPNYDTLKLRLEATHSAVEAAAVEARRRVRLNEGR